MSHQAVLQYIQERGPSVPNEIRQGLKLKDNFLAGALLSELVAQGKLALTSLSHGTSKFYYDPEHPETLEQVSIHLGEKDQRAYQLLRQERVVRAADLSPLMRVAVASIKDYSRQLILDTPAGEQEFYRYYLVPQEEAINLVKEKFFGIKETKPAEPPLLEQKLSPAEHKLEKKKRQRKPKTTQQTQTQQTQPAQMDLAYDFAKQVHDYFEQKQISLLQVIEQKKVELSLIVSMPTPVGLIHYYCKTKSKKTTGDGDLAAAYLEAEQHKLPLLYIAAGSLSKKAQELINTQLKGTLIVQPWESH